MVSHCVWISEPVTSVDTGIFAPTCLFKLGPPWGPAASFIWTSQEGYTLPFRKWPVWPGLQAGFWLSIQMNPAANGPDSITDSHSKVHPHRWPSSSSDTVALDKQLESTWITKRWSQFTPPPAKMVAAGRSCASRSTITPTEYALQILTNVLRRVGCSLKGTHCKEGNLRQWQLELRLLKRINQISLWGKWYVSNQVDVRAPPLKAIADFPLYLFQDRNLQPGTIDGYRPAIANNWEICPLILAKMKISLISWIVSTKTDPR